MTARARRRPIRRAEAAALHHLSWRSPCRHSLSLRRRVSACRAACVAYAPAPACTASKATSNIPSKHIPSSSRGGSLRFLSAQRRLEGGRADLIFRTGKGRYAVVEVKRGQASATSVDQALPYAVQLRAEYLIVQPWVVARVITVR
jgi:hypothetical protein